jgi:WD40 repeat protein
MLATGADDRTIKLWDRATGAELATLTGHAAEVVALAFTPDGKTLVSSGSESVLRLWQVSPPREIERTPAQLQTFNRLRRYSPYIFVAPDGKKLYVWLPNPDTRIKTLVECFDLNEGKQLFQFVDDNRSVNSLAFCANGKLVATGAKDGSVRLHDLEQQGAILPGGDWLCFDKAGAKEAVGVADLALTPDGKTLVVTSDEGEVKIGDIASRTMRKTFKAHDGRIMACVTSPDGKRCATVGLDNIVKLWDLETARELRRWPLGRPATEMHGLLVSSLAFAPDGRQLATANTDTTVYLLDLP